MTNSYIFALFCVCSFAILGSACANAPIDGPASGAGTAGQLTSGGAAGGADPGGPLVAGGASGTTASGGGIATGGASPAGSGGIASDGGATSTAGSSAGSTAAGSAGAFGGSSGSSSTGGEPAIPAGCKVSNPVSFKADIGPWLAQSCGKASGGGCHVTDDSSTAGSLCPDGTKTCGFTHAYDWITAGSHNEFCKQTPAPIRYTVVMAVLESANPPSCTKTRVMPPDGPPATECQKAALAAWLAEPKALQLHRADDTSPTSPYPMPPFN